MYIIGLVHIYMIRSRFSLGLAAQCPFLCEQRAAKRAVSKRYCCFLRSFHRCHLWILQHSDLFFASFSALFLQASLPLETTLALSVSACTPGFSGVHPALRSSPPKFPLFVTALFLSQPHHRRARDVDTGIAGTNSSRKWEKSILCLIFALWMDCLLWMARGIGHASQVSLW